MPQQSISCILIIGLYLERFRQLANRPYDFISQFILNHAGFHRDNLMGTLSVHAGNNISLSVSVKNCMHFISIVGWIFHPHNGMDFAIFSHQFSNHFFFYF